ncbi:hypothetical protein SKAU_G00013180 [Synaphobranchus kaupii]|uniref:Uncharacterized protein n=1 Tax=Synaphobranchus kaupii TaxID=118154 RepID=A0A9Q1GAD7_SYNKA|nr:hypothetical protein SKAU_G00013180 [Synaphobranchus kaupii]
MAVTLAHCVLWSGLAHGETGRNATLCGQLAREGDVESWVNVWDTLLWRATPSPTPKRCPHASPAHCIPSLPVNVQILAWQPSEHDCCFIDPVGWIRDLCFSAPSLGGFDLLSRRFQWVESGGGLYPQVSLSPADDAVVVVTDERLDGSRAAVYWDHLKGLIAPLPRKTLAVAPGEEGPANQHIGKRSSERFILTSSSH